MSSARGIGLTVLILGLAASVTAVVFGVGEGLLHASKAYLVITSLIGLVALMAGIVVFVNQNETMLAALVASTGALWAVSEDPRAGCRVRGTPRAPARSAT